MKKAFLLAKILKKRKNPPCFEDGGFFCYADLLYKMLKNNVIMDGIIIP